MWQAHYKLFLELCWMCGVRLSPSPPACSTSQQSYWRFLRRCENNEARIMFVLLSSVDVNRRRRAVNQTIDRATPFSQQRSPHFRSVQWDAEESCRDVHLARRWHGARVNKNQPRFLGNNYSCQVCLWQLRLGAQAAPIPADRRQRPFLHVHQSGHYGGASGFQKARQELCWLW